MYHKRARLDKTDESMETDKAEARAESPEEGEI